MKESARRGLVVTGRMGLSDDGPLFVSNTGAVSTGLGLVDAGGGGVGTVVVGGVEVGGGVGAEGGRGIEVEGGGGEEVEGGGGEEVEEPWAGSCRL